MLEIQKTIKVDPAIKTNKQKSRLHSGGRKEPLKDFELRNGIMKPVLWERLIW